MLKQLLTLNSLLLFLCLNIYSQTPPYYHYTSSDGLASSTVFDIIQSHDGYIWFGTLNGLSRFDGKHFKNFNTTDGLNSNVITSLLEGHNGEIYIGNYEKGLNVLKNDTIKNFRKTINGSNFSATYLLGYLNNIYAFTSYGVLIFIKKDKLGNSQNDHLINTSPQILFKLAKLRKDSLVALSSSGLFLVNEDKFRKLPIAGLPEKNSYCLAQRSNGDYFVGTSGYIYQIRNNRVIKTISIDKYQNNQYYVMYCDKKDNIWCSVFGRGFICIQAGTNKIIDYGEKMGLENTQVDAFFDDSEGNIWVSTFGKGIYCLNNLYLRTYDENDGLINNNIVCLESNKDGKIFIGTINGINILENEQLNTLNDSHGEKITGYVNNIKCYGDSVFVCSIPEKGDIKYLNKLNMHFYFSRMQSFVKAHSNLLIHGSIGNNIRVTNEFKSVFTDRESFYIFGDSNYRNRINALAVDSKNNLWVGTSDGLCKISGITYEPKFRNWKRTYFKNNHVLNSKINSIYCDQKNRVWFTGVNGVAYYNLNNDSISTFTSLYGHKLSTPTSVAMDGKSRMWIGTMKGLYLLDGNSVKFLDSQIGLPSDEVLSLLYDNKTNTLYIGTSNGLSQLDISGFDNYAHQSLDVKINRVQAGDSVYTDYNNLVFNPNQNNVYINYRVIDYSSPASVKYKYILNGESRETKNDFLDFSSLEKGNYKLQIIAGTQNAGWGKPIVLSFKILPRFVETFWFDLIIIAVILFTAILILIWRLKLNKKKNAEQLELTERINDLKHQALSAMMNPHFIFNSLNSVQYLVNDNRLEEANDYIAMMAKLMRKNLDTAGNGFILLSEEINRLKLYLDLEKLRFQDSFIYEIITATDVEAESIMIPNMIIQPFVENSLWHGIIDSGIKGTLTISFTFENVDIDSVICKSLIIKVTDNGIGIKEAKKNKKEDHISKGIQIIEERLRLLSTKMQLPQPIMFEDLSSRESDSHGTEVIISLPPQLYKIISAQQNQIPTFQLTD